MPVFFHSEETDFHLKKKNLYKKWIKGVIESRDKRNGSINVIFTSNRYILDINTNYLNHNYFTDVITFSYNDGNIISGDIFVSVDQVKINSKERGITFLNELNRVIIHGILHLLSFNDTTDIERVEMQLEEDKALAVLQGMCDGNEI